MTVPFPHLAPDERRARALDLAEAARGSSFYRARFEGVSEWRDLPVLTHDELFANTYPRSTAMLTRPMEGMIVTSTGGSSGIARYTVMTWAEWDAFCDMQARAFGLLGIAPSDRVANLFIAGHLWPSFLGVHEAVKHLGAVHLPISANIPPEEIMRLCREFRPTVMLSLPTLFIFLADLARKEGSPLEDLRLIAYAGEQMSSQAQDHVRRSLGVREIRAAAYTSADCGLMGYQCASCGFGAYHLPTEFQFLEIVDDSGADCPPGAVGELLVTNLARRSMPIVRYRIGDLGSWTGDPCACGDPNPVYRLHGRAGDDFKLGGAFISMDVFEESLALFPDAFSMNYQVTLQDVGNQMDVVVSVESGDPAAAGSARTGLEDELRRRIPEIRVGQEKDYLRVFEVRPVALGSLPRNPNTGKVKRLDDRRVVG